MTKRNEKRIKEIGEPEMLIPEYVNRYGQHGAAKRLGVSQAWLHLWLKNNGYRRITSWKKDGLNE